MGGTRPAHQQVRTTASGRVYLDVWWEHLGVGVEIEGAHHAQGLSAVDDALRQNDIVLDDGVILRLPVLGFRLLEERFMRQVEKGLRAAARQRGVPLR